MPPKIRVRPYKDFLTPALHRRFAMATAVLAMLCYAEALLIGEWNSCKYSTQLQTENLTLIREQSSGHGFHLAEPAYEQVSCSFQHS